MLQYVMRIKRLKQVNRQFYRLFVKKSDNKIYIDEYGNHLLKYDWHEVSEVNLGSKKNPNRDIKEIKLVPVEYERENL